MTHLGLKGHLPAFQIGAHWPAALLVEIHLLVAPGIAFHQELVGMENPVAALSVGIHQLAATGVGYHQLAVEEVGTQPTLEVGPHQPWDRNRSLVGAP